MKFEPYDGQESIEITPGMTLEMVLEGLDVILQEQGIALVHYHDFNATITRIDSDAKITRIGIASNRPQVFFFKK